MVGHCDQASRGWAEQASSNNANDDCRKETVKAEQGLSIRSRADRSSILSHFVNTSRSTRRDPPPRLAS